MKSFRLLLVASALLVPLAACNPNDEPTDAGTSVDTDAGLPDAGPEICNPLPERFDANTTLAKGCYLAAKSPQFGSEVTLTLDPGVKIVFSPETGISLSGGQVLIAAGTSAEPILFTADQPERGRWKGLHFDGTSTESRLDYVTVEYGGDTQSDADAACVKLTSDSRGVRLAMSHTTVRECEGWGLWAGGAAVISQFAQNTLTKNTLGPASLDSQVVGVIDAASSFKGNDRDQLEVRAGRIDNAATWPAIDVPYFLDGGVTANAEWTIGAGATLVLADEAEVTVSGDEAALIAKGTSDKPIRFTGATATRGAWTGITFDGSMNAKNELAWTTVEYAGQTAHDADAAAVKLIADSHGVAVALTHTTLKESQGWGLYLTGSAVLPRFSNNTFTLNTLGPASVQSEVVGVLDTTSTYTGNDVDRVRVRAYHLSQPATWKALGVPYFLESSLRLVADLTVAPGVTFIMDDDTWLDVSGDDAALIANGTAAQPIVFTSDNHNRGAWSGISFGGSNNDRNALSHVTVEWAGSTAHDADGADVKLTADSHGVQVKISGCTFHQSQGYGLYVAGSGLIPNFAGNTLTENELGPVKIMSEATHQLLSTSTYTGNDVDKVFVHTNRIPLAVTWLDLGVPYQLDSYLHVDDIWTLAPGVKLIMEEDGSIDVGGDDAAMHAVGTTEKPIVITGLTQTRGAWGSIVFDTNINTANLLDHCTVEYGGGAAAAGDDGMIVARSDSHGVVVSITNSTIQHSAVYGLWLGRYWSGSTTGNTYADNASGDVFHQP